MQVLSYSGRVKPTEKRAAFKKSSLLRVSREGLTQGGAGGARVSQELREVREKVGRSLPCGFSGKEEGTQGKAVYDGLV